MYVDSGGPRLDAVLEKVNWYRRLADKEPLGRLPIGGHNWHDCPLGQAIGRHAKLVVNAEPMLQAFVRAFDHGRYPMVDLNNPANSLPAAHPDAVKVPF